jgi:hypothetical protein
MMTIKTTTVLDRIAGYEELGTVQPLSMLLSVNWWVVQAYHQRDGRYGLLIHESNGTPIRFLATQAEIDELCALIEFCMDRLAYWPACEAMVREWREIWWMAQTAIVQQWLREREVQQ